MVPRVLMGKMRIREVKGCAQSTNGKPRLKLGHMESNLTLILLYHFHIPLNYIHTNYKSTNMYVNKYMCKYYMLCYTVILTDTRDN